MQANHFTLIRARQAGFGLIELMVAIVLGLLITAAVTAMAVNSLKMSSDTLKSARLNQDLGAVMQIMVNDIRRAGYSEGGVIYNTDEDIFIGDVDNDDPPDDGDCILYRYNKNENGSKTDENYGFRRIVVNGVGVLQMAGNTGAVACNAANNWVSMTDPNVIDIANLAFTSTGSTCLNVDATDYWITTGTTATGFPCMGATGDTSVTFYKQNTASPPVYVTQTYDPPDTASSKSDIEDGVGHMTAETRQVNIQLQGQLTVADDNEVEKLTVSKNLDASVKIRNNLICSHITSGYASDFASDYPVVSACVH